MAKIQILGQFDCVTAEGILAISEQIKYGDTTVKAALDNAQGLLTFDSTPTENSTNPVTSGGLYTSFSNVDAKLGSSSDTASASGTTAWSRIKQSQSDITTIQNGLGTSSDAASASGTTAWSRIKQNSADITTVKNGLGTSSDTASASGTTAWSRIKQAQADITTIKSGLGTSSDTASASGTTAWSRIKQNQTDITTINGKLGTSTDAASASSTAAWPRIKNAESNITSLQSGLGTSADAASASGTTAWSRIKQNSADIATIQAAIAGLGSNLILYAQNKTVATSAWTASGDSTYAYKADVTMTGLDAAYFPIVQFEDADIASFAFSPSVTPKTNAVTLYCQTKPNRTITIPNIICFKGTAV